MFATDAVRAACRRTHEFVDRTDRTAGADGNGVRAAVWRVAGANPALEPGDPGAEAVVNPTSGDRAFAPAAKTTGRGRARTIAHFYPPQSMRLRVLFLR